MANAADQGLSVLSSSKHGLIYLTANDWALITDKAARKNFSKGQTIIYRAKKSNGIYLLMKGTARVEIAARPAALIGSGQICGEMSFLDDVAASANVIAQDQVETYFVDRPTLESLFELFPHLASRFYRSLAVNLSRRLRELIKVDQLR